MIPSSILLWSRDKIAYLLRDLFSQDQAAPLGPVRKANTGYWKVVDTAKALSVSGGILVNAGANASTDPRVTTVDSFARVAGRAMLARVSIQTGGYGRIGWSNSPTVANNDHHIGPFNAATYIHDSGQLVQLPTELNTVGTWVDVAAILRATGAFYLKRSAGGQWKLIWVSNTQNNSPLWAIADSEYTAGSTSKWDDIKVVDLGGKWQSDYGIATSQTLSPTIAGNFACAADGIIEWNIVHDGASYCTVSARYKDSNNQWIVQVDPSGNIDLFEKNAGTLTTRGHVGAAVGNGTASRLMWVFDGNVHTIYLNNTLLTTYTDVNNFQTNVAQGRQGSGNFAMIKEIVAWPRYISPSPIKSSTTKYLLDSQFTSQRAAPLPATLGAEPGPGSWKVTDTETKLSVDASGELVASGGKATPAWGDPAVWSTGTYSRSTGRAVYARVKPAATNKHSMVGFDIDQTSNAVEAIYFNGANDISLQSPANTIQSGKQFAAGTWYEVVTMLGANLLFYFVKGGVFTDWTLLYVADNPNSATTRYVGAMAYNDAVTFDKIQLLDLADIQNDFALATTRVQTVSLNTNMARPADALVEYTLTFNGTDCGFCLRYQDIDNYWYCYTDTGGNVILYQKQNGSLTARGTYSSAFTNGTTHRFLIVDSDNVITVYIDNTQGISYTDPSGFLEGNGISRFRTISGGVKEFVSWPRYPSININNLRRVTRLLDSQFTSPRSSLPATLGAEPGPGVLTVVDTGNNLSISDEVMNSANSVNSTDPRIYNASGNSRVAGRSVIQRVYRNGGTYGATVFSASVDGHSREDCVAVFSNAVFVYTNGALLSLNSPSNPSGWYRQAIILRSIGAFYLTAPDGGPWTLQWVGNAGGAATVYPGWQAGNGGYAGLQVSDFTITDLGGLWSDDYGIATDRLAGAVSNGTTFTHNADTLIEFIMTTLPTAGVGKISFRTQDSTNYWDLRVDSTGQLYLTEVVANTSTLRGSSAGAVAAGNRVVLVADGTTLTAYSNNTQKITYASAANFVDETAGAVSPSGGSVISDLVSWPRYPTVPNY